MLSGLWASEIAARFGVPTVTIRRRLRETGPEVIIIHCSLLQLVTFVIYSIKFISKD